MGFDASGSTVVKWLRCYYTTSNRCTKYPPRNMEQQRFQRFDDGNGQVYKRKDSVTHVGSQAINKNFRILKILGYSLIICELTATVLLQRLASLKFPALRQQPRKIEAHVPHTKRSSHCSAENSHMSWIYSIKLVPVKLFHHILILVKLIHRSIEKSSKVMTDVDVGIPII